MAGKSKYFSKLWIYDFRIFGFRIFGFRVLITYRLKTYRNSSAITVSRKQAEVDNYCASMIIDSYIPKLL
jgi:hypothetical protein